MGYIESQMIPKVSPEDTRAKEITVAWQGWGLLRLSILRERRKAM